jgi:glycosyltransferase involved in cell wall biosynthesis
MAKPKTICFFAKVKSREALNHVEFYAQDIAVLKDLGYQIHIATTPRDLIAADAYFAWWWTWAFLPVAYAGLKRKPVVVTGVFDLWRFDSRPSLHRLLHRMALKRANANIFVSMLEREQVPERLSVRAPAYSPLIVDTDLYRPLETPHAEREEFALTFAGSGMNNGNSRRKCIEELIRATPLIRARYPRLRFVIAGQKGTDYPTLAAVADEVGASDYIEFPGIVSRERKIELMQRCAVYLQPSRFEGFGVSILEAMSCGAAVVSSPVGAVPEVVGECGAMADGADPAAIAAQTIDLLADGARLTQLRRRARERAVEQFGFQRRRNDLGRILAEVAA